MSTSARALKFSFTFTVDFGPSAGSSIVISVIAFDVQTATQRANEIMSDDLGIGNYTMYRTAPNSVEEIESASVFEYVVPVYGHEIIVTASTIDEAVASVIEIARASLNIDNPFVDRTSIHVRRARL